MLAEACARLWAARRQDHSAVAAGGYESWRSCRSRRCYIVAVCAGVGEREMAVDWGLASSGWRCVSSFVVADLHVGSTKAQDRLRRRNTGSGKARPLVRGEVSDGRLFIPTYQFAREFPTVSVCKSYYVVSYYTSQSPIYIRKGAETAYIHPRKPLCAAAPAQHPRRHQATVRANRGTWPVYERACLEVCAARMVSGNRQERVGGGKWMLT